MGRELNKLHNNGESKIRYNKVLQQSNCRIIVKESTSTGKSTKTLKHKKKENNSEHMSEKYKSGNKIILNKPDN